jgi:hypothetical protein
MEKHPKCLNGTRHHLHNGTESIWFSKQTYYFPMWSRNVGVDLETSVGRLQAVKMVSMKYLAVKR